jgi:hypothetical protein
MTPYSTNRLDEPEYARRSLLASAISPSPFSLVGGAALSMPAWPSLQLHRRFWAEGDALELCLDVDGEAVSRALATRDGPFLFGPTGPAWARELAQEAANEWRSDLDRAR